MPTPRLHVAFAALLTISLLTTAVAPAAAQNATDDNEITDIGTQHPLSANHSIDDFQRTGSTTGALERYQITLTVSKDGDAVGLDPSIARDARNRYLRIEYQETHARTLRILIPREYRTPYTMEQVESLTSGHVASYQPARDGEYTAITIRFNAAGTAVLPLRVDDGASYTIVERVDSQIESVTGISPLGRSGDWAYIDGETVADQAAYPVNASADGILIQYDAKPRDSEQVWVNAPRGEDESAPVYYFDRDGDDQFYIVSGGAEEPDVRVKYNPSRTDRVRGDVNDIRMVPDRIEEEIGGLWPF